MNNMTNKELAEAILTDLAELERRNIDAYENLVGVWNLSIPAARLLDYGCVTGLTHAGRSDMIMCFEDVRDELRKVQS